MSRSIYIANGQLHERNWIRNFFSPDVSVTIGSSADLLFPTTTGKPYYRKGDFILGGETTERQAGQRYKEFEDSVDFTWGRFLLTVLEADKVKTVWCIEAIHGDGDRRTVVMRTMWWDGKGWVQLTTRRGEQVVGFRMNEMRHSFIWATVYHSTKVWIPIFKAEMEVLMLFFSGPAKSAGKQLGKKLLERYGPKLLVRLFEWMGKKYAKIFAAELAKFTDRWTCRLVWYIRAMQQAKGEFPLPPVSRNTGHDHPCTTFTLSAM